MSGRLIACASVFFSACLSADTGFRPGNLLIATDNVVCEYSTNGVVQQQIAVPENTAADSARDVLVLDDHRLAVYNDTFKP